MPGPKIVYPTPESAASTGNTVSSRKRSGIVIEKSEDGKSAQVALWEPQEALRYAAVAASGGSNFTLRASFIRFQEGTPQRGKRIDNHFQGDPSYHGPPVVHCCRNIGPEPFPSRLFHYVTKLEPMDGRAVQEFAAAVDADSQRLVPEVDFLPGIMCSACVRYLAPFRPVVKRVWRTAGEQFCCFGNREGCPRLIPCVEATAAPATNETDKDSLSKASVNKRPPTTTASRDGWVIRIDESTGMKYEMCEATGESRWLEDDVADNDMSPSESHEGSDVESKVDAPHHYPKVALKDSPHAKQLLLEVRHVAVATPRK